MKHVAIISLIFVFTPIAFSLKCYDGIEGQQGIKDCHGSCAKTEFKVGDDASTIYICLPNHFDDGYMETFYCNTNLCNGGSSSTASPTYPLLLLALLFKLAL